MTLGELVDLVCTKVHRNDDESRAEARKYIRSRYQIIWDSRAWRDTMDILTMQGTQIVNEFGEPLIDENGEFIFDGLVDQVLIMPAVVGKVIALRWGNMTTLTNEEMGTVFFIDPNLFNTVGDPLSFSCISSSGLPQNPGGRSLIFTSTGIGSSFGVTIRGTLGNVDQSEVVMTSGTGQVTSSYSYDFVSSLSKDSQSYDLVVRDDLGTPLMTLPREETFRRHQRIHFHSTPQNPGEMLALYKKRYKDLVYDSDSTEIEGIDNMLLAAAISDMREGERQYGKAQAKSLEVAGLMDMAIRLEREQSASNPRIIPTIYDWPWEGPDTCSKSNW
jgi:hypothetical protein